MSRSLRQAGGCGTFQSGSVIEQSLSNLGGTAQDMSARLRTAIDDYNQKVVDAGGLITQQEAENARQIKQAGEGSGKDSLGLLPTDFNRPYVAPNGPNDLDNVNAALTPGLPPVPAGDSTAAGNFPCPATPESVFGLTLDDCFQHLSSAEMGKLTMLADQWKQLSTRLTSANTTFHQLVQSQMAQGHWTGDSGKAVGDAAHRLIATTSTICAQASANGAAIVAWAGSLGDTKSYIDTLHQNRDKAVADAPYETKALVQNQFDAGARFKMMGTYNPAVTAISTSLSSLSDPAANSAAVPIGFGTPPAGTPGGSVPSGTSGSSLSGGSTGGSPSGGSSGADALAAARRGTDPAGQLSRQATGDPAAAAKSAQNGAGNPASAAQQAMSKAGDTAKGLTGKPGPGAPTRPAGLGSLSDAERAAKAESALKGGGGAGGGAGKLGGGGGGGLGAAAAAEAPLGRNSASAMTAAEKAMAGQAGAPAARAATPASAGPMGARGAGAHQGEEGKQHKAAKYLHHTENGEEIAGELPDTAPPVLGGLNLDTTDDTEHAAPKP
jgi:hypothetical protein